MVQPKTAQKMSPPKRNSRSSDGKVPGIVGSGQSDSSYWTYGIHAVAAALTNPRRKRYRLLVTRNAEKRLSGSIVDLDVVPEIVSPKAIEALLGPDVTHQGAALLVEPLETEDHHRVSADIPAADMPVLVLLDRVTDPMNTGAILRSAAAFGAGAVIAPKRHSAPESGALAKAASGSLESLPYRRVVNLAMTMRSLSSDGYHLLGLEGSAPASLEDTLPLIEPWVPIAFVLGSEGVGLRHRTRSHCHQLVRIGKGGSTGSLNVSVAAAICLYAESVRQCD
ncbi:MAG: RNA methyltransferase [Paracoccaceae bacterium]|nr:RNA methyltransferase [Paracoccaceae bacterium]